MALPSAAYQPQRPDDKARWIDSVVTQKVGGLGMGSSFACWKGRGSKQE